MGEPLRPQGSVPPPHDAGTVADIMRPPVTTPRQNDHAAAAAYLMKHSGTSALLVLDAHTEQPIGIITEADITRAVADSQDLNEVRIRQLMTASPAVIGPSTTIREAAQTMTSGRFRHLPVVGEAGLAGIVDVIDICQALLDLTPPPPAS